MKPMLEGEFRRFRVAIWLIRPILFSVPAGLIVWGLAEINAQIILTATLITIQNAFVLWILKRTL